jgi:hypothetical protein
MSTNAIGMTIGGLRTYRADRPRFMRSVLWLDAAVTGSNAVAYLALAPVLDSVLGIPASTLYAIGAFLLVYSVGVAAVARQRVVNRTAVGVIAAGNLAWVAASIAMAVTGAFSPTTVGTTWAIMQAVVVAAFADLQFMALRGKPAGR